ncbi:MAG: hypothetical protein V1862_11360 [Methanobacteriota archaeon]
MVKEWKITYDTYRPRLNPNNKTAVELIAYLTQKYPVTELTDERRKQVVRDNVLLNECHAKKLPAGKAPVAKVFLIENIEAGTYLYENQDDLFKGIQIIIGFDLETAFFLVEGSSLLWDELFAFRGLDEDDLTNFYLVAEYISCVQKSGMLENVLNR